jgi:hypothetical protein
VLTLLVLALALFSVAIFALRLTLRLRRFQDERQWHPLDFTRRLTLIESRLERLETDNGSASRAKPPSGSERVVPADMTKEKISVPSASEGRGLPQQGGVPLIAVPDLTTIDSHMDGNAEPALGDRYTEIWSLAAAGVPGEDIARRTGQPIGQVELIIGLYRQIHSGRSQVNNARTQ